jgi:endo-1,4-beta-xylanase
MRTKHLPTLFLSLAYGIAGCGSDSGSEATGGSGGSSVIQQSSAGAAGSGGASSSVPTGGNSSVIPSGGVTTGGATTGGTSAKGGTSSATTTTATSAPGGAGAGGTSAAGGTSSVAPTGGTATGGTTAKGGSTAKGGTTTSSGGAGGTSTGSTPTGGSTPGPDCSAAMPTSGGTAHCGSYQRAKAGTLEYELWSNSYSSSACITTYSVPAFSAKWSNNSDFLARLGISWGGKTLATLGTVTADFSVKKSGDSGGYSYIGVYGWAKSPCTEYYIIDDSMKSMPFNPWGMTQTGSATIDGEVYKFYSGQTNGTGGSQCGTPFKQNWSVRQKGRSCGTITISKHFEEWGKNGMSVDGLLEAKVLVEAGGGTGSVEFPIANVKASN